MNANHMLTAVMDLDLEPIKTKLMHVESGEGWSQAKAEAVEKEYRRFLGLMKLYPDEDTAPLVDVDTFWHYHILDTMKYAVDCDAVFGYFLHHYPYVGMRGGDDDQFRLDSGERMRTLYEATFGETYPGALAAADTAFCAGPHDAVKAQATAFCAGPHGKVDVAGTAFCAGPHAKVDAAGTAFCAGPHAKAQQAGGADTAFCAGPHTKATPVASAVTAFCAGPHAKVNAQTAFCAGPHAKTSQAVSAATAFCAGPHAKLNAQATAFCAGPHAKVDAQTAFCAGPHAKK